LQAAGYETAFIGKWHISANARDLQAVFNCDGKPRPEFDFWVSFKGQGEYQNPLINVNGIESNAAGHITDILTDHALEFLSREHTRPFFLMLSHKAAHDPFTPQDRFLGIYNQVDVPVPATYGEDISDKPGYLRCLPFGANAKNRARRYYELLAGIDESVGKILAKLEEKNILQETLIIFTSDNGLMMGAHNIAGKNVAYEESIRIPLFVRYPNWFSAGTVVVDDFTLNIDIAPTIFEAANVQIPAELLGISLRRFVAGEAHRKSFLYESFRFQLPRSGVEGCLPELRAVRTKDYKYVTYLAPQDKDELYDLNKDPIEADNRIDDPVYAGVLRQLQTQLDSLRLAAGDTLETTGVAHPKETAPLEFALLPNYPNPFNAGTKIQYVLPHAARVRLKVFDVYGRQVATIVDEIKEAGIQTATFDASRVASGIYFCQLVAGDFVATKKMMTIK
jgi:N-acetylglucosamine-6-sulfatase